MKLSAGSDLSIVIPTVNSGGYIDLILEYYLSLGLTVTVFLDLKTIDETGSMCRSLGCPVVEISNPTWRVEYAIEKISRLSGTPWILRMDDDELPSKGMLEYIDKVISDGDTEVVGFPRYQCGVRKSGELLFHRDQDPFVRHRQFRLYRPDRMKYHSTIHSAGFDLQGAIVIEAPSDACMIHLDWVVHSYLERVAKVKRYDEDTAGMGSIFRDHLLPEETPNYPAGFAELDLPEFRQISLLLAARYPRAAMSAA